MFDNLYAIHAFLLISPVNFNCCFSCSFKAFMSISSVPTFFFVSSSFDCCTSLSSGVGFWQFILLSSVILFVKAFSTVFPSSFRLICLYQISEDKQAQTWLRHGWETQGNSRAVFRLQNQNMPWKKAIFLHIIATSHPHPTHMVTRHLNLPTNTSFCSPICKNFRTEIPYFFILVHSV